MVNQIYSSELQLNKANTSDTSIYFNGFVSSKIYDKRDDFDFDIVDFWIVTFHVNPLMECIFLKL